MKKKELKKRIARLEADLHELVLRPNSEKSIQIKMAIKIAYDFDKAVWNI